MQFAIKSAAGTVITVIALSGALSSCGADTSSSTPAPAATTGKTVAPAKTANVPAEYEAALEKAQTYSDMMHMSKKGLYQQLTSAAGEKFPKAAAQYAVDNVKADFKANALAKAESYRDTMSMSKAAIRDQLTSAAGEQFTAAEADYAIANMGK